jgi:hypothetical protein
MRYVLVFLALTGSFVAQQQSAQAIFFDLHGLGTIGGPGKTITVNGISLFLDGSPLLFSTSTHFGIDGIGGADVPDLLDGGNGSIEVLHFGFSNNDTLLDSILISDFGGDDAGSISIKSLQSLIPVSNGVNPINALVSTSGHSIQWGGPNSPAAGRGFSVDGFNVHLVPEPSIAVLLGCVIILSCAPCRKRRSWSNKRAAV